MPSGDAGGRTEGDNPTTQPGRRQSFTPTGDALQPRNAAEQIAKGGLPGIFGADRRNEEPKETIEPLEEYLHANMGGVLHGLYGRPILRHPDDPLDAYEPYEGERISFAGTVKSAEKIGSDYEIKNDVSFVVIMSMLGAYKSRLNNDAIRAFEVIQEKARNRELFEEEWRNLEKTADEPTRELMRTIVRVSSKSRPMGISQQSNYR